MNNELIKRIISSVILIPIAIFFIIKGSFPFIFFLLILFFVTFYEWYKMSKNKSYFEIGILFLLISFICTYFERVTYGLNQFLTLIIICVFTDIGGYIFGKLFKGPKLSKISPNKTYAGMIGGFLLSVIAFTLFTNNLEKFGLSIYVGESSIRFVDLIFVLSISLVSQFGDLTISYFKRKSKIKNTGNLLPGHGGILDRIDGMIFAIPYVYILNLII